MWGRDDDGKLFWATVVFAPFPKLLDGTERHHRPLMSIQSPCRCPSRPDSTQALELPTCSPPAWPRFPLISREAGFPPPMCSSVGLPKPRSPPSGFPAASHCIQNSTTLGRRLTYTQPGKRPHSSLQMDTGHGIVTTFQNAFSVSRPTSWSCLLWPFAASL